MKSYDLQMTDTEVKPISLEVVDLQEGEVVVSATAEHTPPGEETPTTITPTVESPYVSMLFGPFSAQGFHFVKVQAEGDNGSKPEVVYQIYVRQT